jgi:4-carboxymuconolactone decarboxylase
VTYDEGMRIRREVLGDEFVERSVANATEFSQPMLDLLTEYCWGGPWARPGLSRRDRSLVNLGMLAALNKPHELRLHTRGALANGCTVQEIQEVLLQVAVYCGVPAGVEAFRVAGEVVAEHQQE